MESHGTPGAIQVTERAHRRLATAFDFENRAIIDVKGKDPMRTYLLIGPEAMGSNEAEALSGPEPDEEAHHPEQFVTFAPGTFAGQALRARAE